VLLNYLQFQLQKACPISVGQQSVIGLESRSDMYIEKVNRWMERMDYVTEIYPDDSDSVLESCSLGASEILEQIVQGRVTNNANLAPTHFVHNKINSNNYEALSGPTAGSREFSTKYRLQSSDSGVRSDSCQDTEVNVNSDYTRNNSDIFQEDGYQTLVEMMRMQLPLINHDQHEDKLQANNDRVVLSLTEDILVIGDQVDSNSTSETSQGITNYIGSEVFTCNQTHYVPSLAEQFSNCTENEDHHVPQSTRKVNQDQCVLKSKEKFGGYVGLDIFDQGPYTPRSAERIDGIMPRSINKLDHVGLDVVDQSPYTLRPSERIGGMEAASQNNYMPRSIEKFDYIGLEVVDQDHHVPKSTEKFRDHVVLEVVDQDHCVHRSTEKFSYNVGSEVIDQNYVTKSTDNCVGLEVISEGHHVPTNLTETLANNYVGLEVITRDYHVPNLTKEVNEAIVDQDHCVSKSTENFSVYVGLEVFDQNCKPCCQDRYELSSDSGHEDEVSDDVIMASSHETKCLQFNNDGYVISPVLTTT